ncbi:hypothetical protein N7508_008973 [Penicillium antarcticum]|uniref:uncharacterized protein n=1 Tax=Penicillium antarcticum TaxID=416450 RepID=UPI0023A0979E|nr:uncharacterized protein N7508_008973 [Penicillium antarcticum]KAJ5294152.1 hypothetical protein N7508_008973 [Penicillium antarcticum]
MAEEEHLKKSHMAIVLGIGLGVVLLIVLSLINYIRVHESAFSFLLFFGFLIHSLRITCDGILTVSPSLTIVINRRDRQSFLRSKKDPDQRLRSLDAVAPICTLEKWWTTTKGNLGLSEAVDGHAVCLEQVDRPHEIRQLRCLHVFHRECLEKWFLGDHFNCPLCHRAYYASNTPPHNDYVWMV